ncbi:BtrH N-terminal domain-containing protein [Marinomonas sp. RSW2]|uniref:BtrH N-terminal domain-containing protein n=1 Tax=Marinomonas maritima TaxID=2940935 RepID=A0ABT5WHG7_9GAMM|nr:BtrH N-terminal domain-containing protein [Marinomonas maritima]MDE8604256.1 BtrH N-terminal domain-containing protein [Marinomonas maritima]
MTIIQNLTPFVGVHCETTASGTLLRQLDIKLSEAMMFGLGEGLGFIFWNMKIMDFPFIGGRVKPLSLTKNLARNLKLAFEIKETSSVKKAWRNAQALLDKDIAVGLQLDSYYLEYFGIKLHFAGHFAAMYGYDDDFAYMVDTKPNGGKVKTSLKSLELARNEKGPMAAKNLLYSLRKTGKAFDLSDAIVTAILNNVRDYLNPPIKNIGYKGILKTSVEIKAWFKTSTDVEHEFCTTAMIMEKAGTGGAIFRNMYRDFLKEAYEITKLAPINEAYEQFVEIAELWTDVASLLDRAGKHNDERLVNKASDILVELSSKEYLAMKTLEKIA